MLMRFVGVLGATVAAVGVAGFVDTVASSLAPEPTPVTRLDYVRAFEQGDPKWTALAHQLVDQDPTEVFTAYLLAMHHHQAEEHGEALAMTEVVFAQVEDQDLEHRWSEGRMRSLHKIQVRAIAAIHGPEDPRTLQAEEDRWAFAAGPKLQH